MPHTLRILTDNIRNSRLTNFKSISGDDTQLLHTNFNNVFSFKYMYGQKVPFHKDRDCFGPVVAGISLGKKSCKLKFKKDESDIIISARVEPGSLYIMTGPARYDYRHALCNKHKTPRYIILYSERITED